VRIVVMAWVVKAWLTVLTMTSTVRAQNVVKPLKSEEFLVRYAYAYFARQLAELKLETRTVIELKNPFLPSWVPYGRRELWFDPAKPQ
jgi:hypothetical protein